MINLPNSMGLGWGQTRDPLVKKCNHLRNEFDFWKVHGIMNTLGLTYCAQVGTNLFSNFNVFPLGCFPLNLRHFHLCDVFVDIHFLRFK